MKIPLRPNDEAQRLEALRPSSLPDTLPDRTLDGPIALPAHRCESPISQITSDALRQGCKPKIGLAVGEAPQASLATWRQRP